MVLMSYKRILLYLGADGYSLWMPKNICRYLYKIMYFTTTFKILHVYF